MQDQSAKRKRSKSPVWRSSGGQVPQAGLSGRLRWSRLLTSNPHHRPAQAFTPFTPHPSAPPQTQSQLHAAPAWTISDGDLQPDAPPPAKQPSRHQQERQQLDDQWRLQIPSLAVRRTCRQALEPQRRQKLKESLHSDFEQRINAAVTQCCHCLSADCLQRLCPAPAITFVTIRGQVAVSTPTLLCTRCHSQYTVHPFSVDCFHATPSRPEIWYDNELLEATSAAQLCGPTAIQAHCATLQQLHRYNGFGPGKATIWQNLSSAAEQWRRVEV